MDIKIHKKFIRAASSILRAADGYPPARYLKDGSLNLAEMSDLEVLSRAEVVLVALSGYQEHCAAKFAINRDRAEMAKALKAQKLLTCYRAGKVPNRI